MNVDSVVNLLDRKWVVNGEYVIADNRAFEKFLQTRDKDNRQGKTINGKISVVRIDVSTKDYEINSKIKLPIKAISTTEQVDVLTDKKGIEDYVNDVYYTKCLLDLGIYNDYLTDIENVLWGLLDGL